jgi:DNA-binding transcriptional LysR family regulator
VDTTLLRYFRVVADLGSLSAAARSLGVAQPTLSAAMARLEAEFGTTLLARDHSGVRLTETGQILREDAGRILALIDDTRRAITGLEADDSGKFVLGCHESLGAYFLPAFVSSFVVSYPKIQLTLWNSPSADVSRALVAREIHYGLIVNPLPHPDLVLIPLFEDAVDLLAVPDEAACRAAEDVGPAFAASTIEAAHQRLRSGPLVLAGRVDQCHQLLDRLAADGLASVHRLACGDLELVKAIVSSGFGVGLLPRRVAAYGQPGRLRRLHGSLPFVPDTICLGFRADLHRTRAAVRLKDALVAHGRGLPRSDVL